MRYFHAVLPAGGAALMFLLTPLLRADAPRPDEQSVRKAISKAIPLLETAAAGSSAHRECFTCHNHGLPVLAITEARRLGFAVDEENLESQLRHTAADLARGKAGYLKGRGQGGRHIRAGYALWTLQAGGHSPDEVTAAAAGYLIWDEDESHWRSPSNRPPSEVSPFTATYLALRALGAFGTQPQAKRIADRKSKALNWLQETKPQETEDRVFRLLALDHLAAGATTIESAAQQLVETQRADGGWAQIADRDSDAYATGSALFALGRTGSVSPGDDRFQRGLQFLLETQLEDGSWHVRSRSKPFQTYYESGFPHGTDQFISAAASSWATLALLLAVGKAEASESGQFPPHTFITSATQTQDLWPWFSPDSQTIVFSRKLPADSTHYLYAVSISGGQPSPLPSPRQPGTRANWSRRKDVIAFNGKPETGTFNLQLMNGDGSGLRKLEFDGINDQMSYASWYPDGKRFAVVDFSPSEGSVIKRINLETEEIETLTDPATHWAGVPRVSPDGRLIVMGGQRRAGQRYTQYQNKLFLLDEEGIRPFDSRRGWAPCWSPDGSWITFASDRNNDRGLWAIFVASADGGVVKQLTAHELHASHPTWSPDGKRIAFSGLLSPDNKARGIAVIQAPAN